MKAFLADLESLSAIDQLFMVSFSQRSAQK